MKDLKTLIRDVERALLANLLMSLKYKRLSKLEVKKIAGEFVEHKYKSYEDLFERLYLMSKSYEEVRKVYVKYAPAYHREKDSRSLDMLRQNYKFILKGDE